MLLQMVLLYMSKEDINSQSNSGKKLKLLKRIEKQCFFIKSKFSSGGFTFEKFHERKKT